MTPGEMEQSLELGCRWVKLFPASMLGLDFIRAIAAPYTHNELRLLPLGGSWLTNRKLAAAGRWDDITNLTRQPYFK